MRKDLIKFFHFAGVDRKFYLLLLLRCPFDFLFTMYHANLLDQSFDAIETQNTGQLYHIFIRFLIAAALLFLYNGTVWFLFARYIVRLKVRVRKLLFEKITSLSYRTVSEKASGEWVTRMNSDAEAAVELLGGPINLLHASVAAVNVVISVVVLGILDYRMLLLCLCFFVPHVLLCLWFLARPMTALREEAQRELGRMTSWIEPIITTAEATKMYDTEDYLRKKVEESSLRLRADHMKIHRKTALNDGLRPLFAITGYLAMLFYGGSQIRAGRSDFGGLTKQIQYRGGILKALMMNINCSMNIRNNMAGVRRVNEIMKMK